MVGAVIVGGGRGERFKGNKVFFPVLGKPLILYTLTLFKRIEEIKHIVVVVRREDIERVRVLTKSINIEIEIVEGGKKRRDSVLAGLRALKKCDIDRVLIHDAVRPLVSPDVVERVISGIEKNSACIPCFPLKETVKFVENGRVVETPDRNKLLSVQTPEGFPFPLILEKIKKFNEDMFDDAVAFEKENLPVKVVEGNVENIKVTYREDIYFVEKLINEHKSWYRL